MSVDLRFRPMSAGGFPRPLRRDEDRKGRPFRVDFTAVRYDLLAELEKLGATEAEISVAVLPHEIRRDGTMPLASANAAHPGVVLWVHTRQHGELTWACDTCRRWQDNVRAISVTLERLRLADLYDVMEGAQYRGFAALPASTSSTIDDANTAIQFLSAVTGEPESAVISDTLRVARLAARRTHPDTGGNREQFHLVQRAREVLGV